MANRVIHPKVTMASQVMARPPRHHNTAMHLRGMARPGVQIPSAHHSRVASNTASMVNPLANMMLAIHRDMPTTSKILTAAYECIY